MSQESQSALLTKGHRDLLDGKIDYSRTDSRGRATRSRLRDRVEVGIQDFKYLADPDRFETQDLIQLIDDEEDQIQLEEGLIEMVAFLYRLYPDGFESIIRKGVERGVRRISPEYEVDEVSVSVRKRGQILDRARHKISNEEPLTDGEVRAMLEHGDMSPDDLRDYVQTHPSQFGEEYRRRFRGP